MYAISLSMIFPTISMFLAMLMLLVSYIVAVCISYNDDTVSGYVVATLPSASDACHLLCSLASTCRPFSVPMPSYIIRIAQVELEYSHNYMTTGDLPRDVAPVGVVHVIRKVHVRLNCQSDRLNLGKLRSADSSDASA